MGDYGYPYYGYPAYGYPAYGYPGYGYGYGYPAYPAYYGGYGYGYGGAALGLGVLLGAALAANRPHDHVVEVPVQVPYQGVRLWMRVLPPLASSKLAEVPGQ